MEQDTHLLEGIVQGKVRSLARAITLVENDLPGHEALQASLPAEQHGRVVGITGPPGAGKSTLINALLSELRKANKRVAVLSVDPSSPFNFGALLGDRVRMSGHYLDPDIFIRSLASRGSLGGLNARIIEILEVMRAAPFDYILIETVGVGQSEVEIAGIADTTVVVVVPEAGDEVQTMKAGVMEIADIFVVNKADRDNADELLKNLRYLAHTRAADWEAPVIRSVASANEGAAELITAIDRHHAHIQGSNARKAILLTEKVLHLIQAYRMRDIRRDALLQEVRSGLDAGSFNLYRFVQRYTGASAT